ncbi:MAG: 30S ribosomal protein S8 [Solirubrobacterales bacterium]|jgi:small subunit ribosomal protein S8|nr:30S ribosomal protein S8 [Solirubrobacterales bacterium]
MLTDPIADYLTRIRNALGSGLANVEVPSSKLKLEMSRILTEQGYISGFEKQPAEVGEKIRLDLKYTGDHQPVISGIERVSRPGRRRYVRSGAVPRVHGGTGTAIVTTSHGVMTGHEAKKEGVGGEVVAYVW